MGDARGAYKTEQPRVFWMKNLKKKDSLEDVDTEGLKEIEWVFLDSIPLARDSDKWEGLVNTAINAPFP